MIGPAARRPPTKAATLSTGAPWKPIPTKASTSSTSTCPIPTKAVTSSTSTGVRPMMTTTKAATSSSAPRPIPLKVATSSTARRSISAEAAPSSSPILTKFATLSSSARRIATKSASLSTSVKKTATSSRSIPSMAATSFHPIYATLSSSAHRIPTKAGTSVTKTAPSSRPIPSAATLSSSALQISTKATMSVTKTAPSSRPIPSAATFSSNARWISILTTKLATGGGQILSPTKTSRSTKPALASTLSTEAAASGILNPSSTKTTLAKKAATKPGLIPSTSVTKSRPVSTCLTSLSTKPAVASTKPALASTLSAKAAASDILNPSSTKTTSVKKAATKTGLIPSTLVTSTCLISSTTKQDSISTSPISSSTKRAMSMSGKPSAISSKNPLVSSTKTKPALASTKSTLSAKATASGILIPSSTKTTLAKKAATKIGLIPSTSVTRPRSRSFNTCLTSSTTKQASISTRPISSSAMSRSGKPLAISSKHMLRAPSLANESSAVSKKNEIIESPLLIDILTQEPERLEVIQEDDHALLPKETTGKELYPVSEIEVPSLLCAQVSETREEKPEKVRIEEGDGDDPLQEENEIIGKELCLVNSNAGESYASDCIHPALTEVVKKNEFGHSESMDAVIKRRRAGFLFSSGFQFSSLSRGPQKESENLAHSSPSFQSKSIAIDLHKIRETKSMIAEALLGTDPIKLEQALKKTKELFKANSTKEEGTKNDNKAISLEASEDVSKATKEEEFELNEEKLFDQLKWMKEELQKILEKKASLEASNDEYKFTYLLEHEKLMHLRTERNSSYEELMAANSWAVILEETCKGVERVVWKLTIQLAQKHNHYKEGAVIRVALVDVGDYKVIMGLKRETPLTEGFLQEKKITAEALKPDMDDEEKRIMTDASNPNMKALYSSRQEFRNWEVDALKVEGKCELMKDYIERQRAAFKKLIDESKFGVDLKKKQQPVISFPLRKDEIENTVERAPLEERNMMALIREIECTREEQQRMHKVCIKLESSINFYKTQIAWQGEQRMRLDRELKHFCGELMASNSWAQELETICLDVEKKIESLREQIAAMEIKLGLAEVIRKDIVSVGGDPRMIISFDMSPNDELLDSLKYPESCEEPFILSMNRDRAKMVSMIRNHPKLVSPHMYKLIYPRLIWNLTIDYVMLLQTV